MKEYYDHPYAALDRDDEQASPLSSNETSNKSFNLRLKHVLFIALSILIAFALFGAGLLFGLEFGRSRSAEGQMQHSEIVWSKTLGQIPSRWTRFDGSLYSTNKYRGAPSSDIDREWDRYTDNEWMPGTAAVLNVSTEAVKVSSNTANFDSIVHLDKDNGGNYMGSLELFHQLHCLNMLRKWTYRDYYSARDPFWTDENKSLRDHTDHCIDILRQVLMCNSDTGLVMFHWAKGLGAPVPDFNTMHRCRDPELVLQWAKENAAPITHHIWKKGGEVELPSVP